VLWSKPFLTICKELFCWPGFNNKFWIKTKGSGQKGMLPANDYSLYTREIGRPMDKQVHCGEKGNLGITGEPVGSVISVLNHLMLITEVYAQKDLNHKLKLMH
jgi:hypothetical protein